MLSLTVLALVLIAAIVLALAALVQIARHPLWSRLVLAAVLTWLFDRPETKRPLRARS